ncbi:MAG TPA: hypothetical protein PLY93_06530 [Turneriella sp.]|nr:hypothetical protein [Turneriella sp.]
MKKISKKWRYLAWAFSLTFVACANESIPQGQSMGAAVTVEKGRFIDAPVTGLSYKTATQSGVTDSDGYFKYIAGENVEFSLGKTILGSAKGAGIVTPEDFAADGLANQKVKNTLRLLQTLDSDGNNANGIVIKEEVRNLLAASVIDLSKATAAFEADTLVQAVVLLARGTATPLVSEVDALSHYLSSRLSGSFKDTYNGQHVLTATAWQLKDSWTDQTDSVVKIDGVLRYIILQKSASDAYNANKYQKVVYIPNNDGSLYTCTLSPFDSATQAAAEAITDTTDKTDPATKGCSGFSWSKLTPVVNPVMGNWKDDWGNSFSIGAILWSSPWGDADTIVLYNAIDSYFIIQKPSNDAYNPSKYQKVILTKKASDYFTCTLSPFNSTTQVTAMAIADTSDKTDPATGGCDGFSWSKLIPN